MFIKCLAIFLGGGIGSLLRYFISVISKKIFLLPIAGTFTVNIIGCLLIGYMFGFTLEKANVLPQSIRLLIVTGFLGGLTTFSTLNIEIFEFIKCGKVFSGLAYLIISCIAGLSATFLGYFLYSRI